MARPPADDPRTKIITIRLTESEHADLARRAGATPLSTFARSLLKLRSR